MTFANAPIGAMNTWLLGQVALSPEERDEDITLVAEAVVSEAQLSAPVDKGFLKAEHDVLEVRDGEATVGAYAEYAAAVHARHPSKAGWFQRAIRMHYRRMMRRQLIWRMRQKGAR